jgi:exopolyphosphatase/guanosine-5'-triphosphate,3'-diphosphate pyrophosphatase
VRVAVADIGSNSTRLLIADVGASGRVDELDRRTVITRLGEGVDASGHLTEAAQSRVLATLDDYARAIDARNCDARVAVLTSAVRDAANGPEFTALVRDRYGFDARPLSGDEEARLTYLGATAGRPRDDVPRAIIDIGGGSTEIVLGQGGEAGFHVSVQAGVVRHTERHLAGDPPRPEELEALADDVRGLLSDALPAGVLSQARAAVAVAGTATSAAAIDLALDPYDPRQVEGHQLSLSRLGEMLSSLAAKPLVERRRVVGLHPDRAPTIVAGIVILSAALRCFGLDGTEVSEHDILWGAAIDAST